MAVTSQAFPIQRDKLIKKKKKKKKNIKK